jgi:RNA 3'-terminal phosphate cyclase (ATP)
MGPQIMIELGRYGFYPPGGGRFDVFIEPATHRFKLELTERGRMLAIRARALVVNLPASMAERELTVVKEKMGLSDEQLQPEISDNAISRGTAVMIELQSEHLTEVFTSIGERGVRAEVIAEQAADEALDYLRVPAPVGEHLADQLLIPLALCSGGTFATTRVSLHTQTNIEVIKNFLSVDIIIGKSTDGTTIIQVRS